MYVGQLPLPPSSQSPTHPHSLPPPQSPPQPPASPPARSPTPFPVTWCCSRRNCGRHMEHLLLSISNEAERTRENTCRRSPMVLALFWFWPGLRLTGSFVFVLFLVIVSLLSLSLVTLCVCVCVGGGGGGGGGCVCVWVTSTRAFNCYPLHIRMTHIHPAMTDTQ